MTREQILSANHDPSPLLEIVMHSIVLHKIFLLIIPFFPQTLLSRFDARLDFVLRLLPLTIALRRRIERRTTPGQTLVLLLNRFDMFVDGFHLPLEVCNVFFSSFVDLYFCMKGEDVE
ncbi:unnamed protein product [Periconia digitata]|uniref:Uncharacterized protein n=1 Tax=Periconia digitata TaxID=1303443 RepID=A0A9W4U569_9PLEO|nr:unnamed protein product [Periconia digitata]